MFYFYSLRSNTPASSIRLPNKGNTMKKSSSANDLHSFGVAKLNHLIPSRRTKSIHDIDTSSKSVRNISYVSTNSITSSEETLRGKFYQTMKKVSTSQQLDEEHYRPAHSAKLIIVKPALPI